MENIDHREDGSAIEHANGDKNCILQITVRMMNILNMEMMEQ